MKLSNQELIFVSLLSYNNPSLHTRYESLSFSNEGDPKMLGSIYFCLWLHLMLVIGTNYHLNHL